MLKASRSFAGLYAVSSVKRGEGKSGEASILERESARRRERGRARARVAKRRWARRGSVVRKAVAGESKGVQRADAKSARPRRPAQTSPISHSRFVVLYLFRHVAPLRSDSRPRPQSSLRHSTLRVRMPSAFSRLLIAQLQDGTSLRIVNVVKRNRTSTTSIQVIISTRYNERTWKSRKQSATRTGYTTAETAVTKSGDTECSA